MSVPPDNPLTQVLADWEDDAECASCGTRAADCCDSMLWGPVMLTCCPACPSFGDHPVGPRHMTVGGEGLT